MNKNIYIMILLVADLGCRKPYSPTVVAISGNYLVVEGVINTGQDSTVIRLSRTVALSSVARTKPEPGAVVTIISDGGVSYPCIEAGKGYYKAAGLNMASGNLGLRINASDGKVYQSDLVPVKNSPPIDSVYYKIQSNSLD